MLLFALVIFCAIVDARERKVLHLPCLGAMAVGLLLCWARGGLSGNEVAGVSLLGSVYCAVGAFLLFGFFCLIGGVGFGDVLLITGVGALVGSPLFMIWVVMLTALSGAPLALFFLSRKGEVGAGVLRGMGSLFKWRYKRDGEGDQKPLTIPYSVAICSGVVLSSIFYLWQARDPALGFSGLPFF